jgi:CHASE2 domain-containing sensor protein
VANWVNEGATDRVIRIVLGLVLGFLATRLHGGAAVVLYILGALALLTGVSGICLLYMVFGIRTCPVRASAQTQR